MGKFLDKFLDTASTLSPTLGEMRWNQLQRDYDRELESESSTSFLSHDSYFDISAQMKEAKHSHLADRELKLEMDEKYPAMLEQAKELATPKNATRELPSGVSADAIDEFLFEVEVDLMPLLDYDFEFDKEYYECDSIECSARDYNESGYDTKSEARADCKQAVKSALEDVKSQYDSEKSYMISAVESELDCMKLRISSIKKEFYKTVVKCAKESLSDETTKEYVIKRFDEVYKKWETENSEIDSKTDKDYSTRFTREIKAYFKEEEVDLSKLSNLYELCDYSQSWRGDYKFSVDGACRTMVSEYSTILKYAVKELPKVVFEEYEELRFTHAAKLYKLLYMLK